MINHQPSSAPTRKQDAAPVPRHRLVFLVVGLAVYSDAALLTSDNLTAAGTAAYVFTLCAFLLELYICYRCAALPAKDAVPKSALLHRSIPDLGWIYCLIQVCLGILFTFVVNVPLWVVVLPCTLLLVLALLVLRAEPEK